MIFCFIVIFSTWQPTEWIVDSFGAKGACVLLAGDGDILPDKKTQLGYKVLRVLMSDKVKLTYQELAKEINCSNEHARRICIKLFTEGKIERKKIHGEYGRPFYRYYFD